MFVKNLPWSATKDSVSELFGDVKVSNLYREGLFFGPKKCRITYKKGPSEKRAFS